jgi:hypothetical protein
MKLQVWSTATLLIEAICIPVSMRRMGSVGGKLCGSAGVTAETSVVIVAVTTQPKLIRFMLSLFVRPHQDHTPSDAAMQARSERETQERVAWGNALGPTLY